MYTNNLHIDTSFVMKNLFETYLLYKEKLYFSNFRKVKNKPLLKLLTPTVNCPLVKDDPDAKVTHEQSSPPLCKMASSLNNESLYRSLITRTQFLNDSSINLFVPAWLIMILENWFHDNSDVGVSWTCINIYGDSILEQASRRVYKRGQIQARRSDKSWIGTTLLNELLVREHNAICDFLHSSYPEWNDQTIFTCAKNILIALIAKIHMTEWLPACSDMRTSYHYHSTQVPDDWIRYKNIFNVTTLIPDSLPLRTKESSTTILRYEDQFQTPNLNSNDVIMALGTNHAGAMTLCNTPESTIGSHKCLVSYVETRTSFGMSCPDSIQDITKHPKHLHDVMIYYENDVRSINANIGCLVEDPDKNGFGETTITVLQQLTHYFIVNDPILSSNFDDTTYSAIGKQWIQQNNFKTMLKRHFPDTKPLLVGIDNPFLPWNGKQFFH